MERSFKIGNVLIAIFASSSILAIANEAYGESSARKSAKLLAARPLDTKSATTTAEDARRFNEEMIRREEHKSMLLDLRANAYASQVKQSLEKAWSATPHNGLLVTKRKCVVNARGKVIEKQIVQDSGMKKEDHSVDTLLDSFSFPRQHDGSENIELIMSFMSDGKSSMVDVTAPSKHNPATFAERRRAAPKHADVDFGPYMADLQRRIKLAWLPPKGYENKIVVIVFKVHSSGAISDLLLDHGSGLAVADQAALAAVQKVGAFRPLPQNSPPVVDIQFTFDFDRYAGGGHGAFRQL